MSSQDAKPTAPLISIVTPCYNEEANVRPLCEAIRKVMSEMPQYRYEHIYIDNASTDGTQEILRDIARCDKNVKVIINSRNFGHIRSPFYGMLMAQGDCVVTLASDFQDPPEMIGDFIRKWEEGYKVVMGVKTASEESKLMYAIRSGYYYLVGTLANIDLVQHATGFGAYDKSVVRILREIDDPYPYFRGLIADIGFEICRIPFTQPRRARGVTKNNFYTLYDMAMLGITNHSKVPLRIATMVGFAMSGVSLIVALIWLALKLAFWDHFTVGVAPILISLFFFGSVQLFFIGILGEYIGAIHTQVQKRPLVIEKERINF